MPKNKSLVPVANQNPGEILKELRNQKKLTQAQLAEKAGMSTREFGSIERGEIAYTESTLLAISDALDVDPNTLLGFASTDSRQNTINAILTLSRSTVAPADIVASEQISREDLITASHKLIDLLR